MILFATEYDPDAPEGASGPKSQYIGKRDLFIMGGVVALIAVFGTPVFLNMKEDTNRSICKKSMSAIARSVTLYAEEHDLRFPPLYESGPANEPNLTDGMPVVWASVLPGLSSGASFTCPSARKDEAAHAHGQEVEQAAFGPAKVTKDHLELTYGMLTDLATRPSSDVANQDQTVLLAETSNFGARGVYNPFPYKDIDGQSVPVDGFAVGYDDSNLNPTQSTKRITRLSFYDKAHGGGARHRKVIQVIYVDGHVGAITDSASYYDPKTYTWRAR